MRFPRNAERPGTLAVLGLGLLTALAATLAQPAQVRAASGTEMRLEDRVLLRRNAPRGLEYVPTSRSGASSSGKASLKVDVLKKVNLDGNAIDNAYSSVLPIDSNRDGKYGYLHWNGHRIMRVFDVNGKKVWQVTNGSGRKQSSEAFIHRDGAAILDLNGDKKDDVLHCWQSGSTKRLVARSGATGKEIRSVSLSGQSNGPTAYCRISVYRQQSNKKPIILVAHQQPGGSAKCGKTNWVDNWTRVVAFDTKLKKLWTTDTCYAGHETAGVDANNDGYDEYFFVGKYALDFKGKIRCSLSGWSKTDHVDGVRVAKLDPKSSRMTAVAVGRTGGGAFDASNCKRLWTMKVKNPQELEAVVDHGDGARRRLDPVQDLRDGQERQDRAQDLQADRADAERAAGRQQAQRRDRGDVRRGVHRDRQAAPVAQLVLEPEGFQGEAEEQLQRLRQVGRVPAAVRHEQ
jgi:hypothetical protein